jgi:hypothetical protein
MDFGFVFLAACKFIRPSRWRRNADLRTPGCMTRRCWPAMCMRRWRCAPSMTKTIFLGPGVTNLHRVLRR